MEKIEIYSYRIGVDVLGFPIIHEHIIVDKLESKEEQGIKGKNISKRKTTWERVLYLFSRNVKQY